jgi:hypothetical protein
MKYFTKSTKSLQNIKILNDAVNILASVGIPISDKTERSLERMAMAFLAVAGVRNDWATASDRRFMKTREIITFVNTNFEENISSGSYDDIRRKDLKLLVLAGFILNSSEKVDAATNDPTRGYSLSSNFQTLICHFGTKKWNESLALFMENQTTVADLLARKRDIVKVPIQLPQGKLLELSVGKHNDLQKAIIEEFLPRYGQGCVILYVGDTSNKMLHIEVEKLKNLNFFELSHDELPDIIAYNENRNWLYLIEAVHSSGAISEVRMLELKRLTAKCTAEIVYVTAFLTKTEFRKWVADIAWESEVWIVENPDHLIHFNGDKFLGPYKG